MCIGCFSFLCLSVGAFVGSRTIETSTAPDVLVITQMESICCREGLRHDGLMPSQSCKTCLHPPWFWYPQKDSFSEPYIALMPNRLQFTTLFYSPQAYPCPSAFWMALEQQHPRQCPAFFTSLLLSLCISVPMQHPPPLLDCLQVVSISWSSSPLMTAKSALPSNQSLFEIYVTLCHTLCCQMAH